MRCHTRRNTAKGNLKPIHVETMRDRLARLPRSMAVLFPCAITWRSVREAYKRDKLSRSYAFDKIVRYTCKRIN